MFKNHKAIRIKNQDVDQINVCKTWGYKDQKWMSTSAQYWYQLSNIKENQL